MFRERESLAEECQILKQFKIRIEEKYDFEFCATHEIDQSVIVYAQPYKPTRKKSEFNVMITVTKPGTTNLACIIRYVAMLQPQLALLLLHFPPNNFFTFHPIFHETFYPLTQEETSSLFGDELFYLLAV